MENPVVCEYRYSIGNTDNQMFTWCDAESSPRNCIENNCHYRMSPMKYFVFAQRYASELISKQVLFKMVDNRRNLCRFSYVENAIFQPSKLELVG